MWLFILLGAAGMTELALGPEPWRTVHDGVMGGVSTGRVESAGEALRFSGKLSLENNGGFASVRRLLTEDLSEARAVRMVVRGDGRRYQLRLRQDDRVDGVAWRALFDTGPDWRVIEVPFSAFEPVFRGRPVPDAGALLPDQLRQLGLMIADKQAGPFELEVRAIQFISQAAASSP
jgi:hypothetical protein